MTIDSDVIFQPLPLSTIIDFPFRFILNPLGPLRDLPGKWTGTGFNTIWRPNSTPGQDRFLELNLTDESIEFTEIQGPIPNRGLLQHDINMFGLTYMQQISDHNLGAGLHIEPGIWAVVPPTTHPKVVASVVRMASIPHGTTVLAQGTARHFSGPPNIPVTNIVPTMGSDPIFFSEMDLSVPTPFRSSPTQIVGITQAMVDDPNSVLRTAIQGQNILATTEVTVTTESTPILGGGAANTAFLEGERPGEGNPDTIRMTSTFWIEVVEGSPDFLQLQYTQQVDLLFAPPSWPHVSVGTLRKKLDFRLPPWRVNPFAKFHIDPIEHRPVPPVPPVPPGPAEVVRRGDGFDDLREDLEREIAARRAELEDEVVSAERLDDLRGSVRQEDPDAPTGVATADGLDEAEFVERARRIAEESSTETGEPDGQSAS